MARPPSNRCVPIGDILSELMGQYRRDSGSQLIRIRELWEETVGARIAQSAQPVAYKQEQLYVNADNSIWIQHLQFLKTEIITGINHSLGGQWVKDIKFRIGPIH
jgi:predicted nucleic acid-binding Zn ribbon protein